MFGTKRPDDYKAEVLPFERKEEGLLFIWPKTFKCDFCGQYKEKVVEGHAGLPNNAIGKPKTICFQCVSKCNKIIWESLGDD